MEVMTQLGVELSIVDGEAGYIVTYPGNVRKFHYTLEQVLTRIATDLTGRQQIVMVL